MLSGFAYITGTKFDAKKFHSKILSMGNVPLSLLKDQMDDWISSQSQGPISGANPVDTDLSFYILVNALIALRSFFSGKII